MYCPAEGHIDDIRAATRHLYEVAETNGFEVVEDWPISSAALAEISLAEKLILLAPGQAEKLLMASLAHELGHFMDPWLQANWEWYDSYPYEGDIEIVAQMAAAIFADWYGIDLLANTDGYLSYWARTSKARREGTVGELLERASISGLSLLPQTNDVTHELDRARQRLRYRKATSGFIGKWFKNPRKEQELGLVDCSDW